MNTVTCAPYRDADQRHQPSVTEGVSIASATQAIQQTTTIPTAALTSDRVSASWGCLQPIIDCIYNIVETILSCFCCCRSTETSSQRPSAPTSSPEVIKSEERIVTEESITRVYPPTDDSAQLREEATVEEPKVEERPKMVAIRGKGIPKESDLEGAELIASVLFAKNATRALRQGKELTQDLLNASIEAGVESRKEAGKSLSLLDVIVGVDEFDVHSTELANATLTPPHDPNKFSRNYRRKLGIALGNLSDKNGVLAVIVERYKDEKETTAAEVFTIVFENKADKRLYHVLDCRAADGKAEIRPFETSKDVMDYFKERSPIAKELRTYRISELLKK